MLNLVVDEVCVGVFHVPSMFEVFRYSGFSTALVGVMSLSACGGLGGDAKPKVELSEQETGFAAVSQDTFTAIAGGTFESSHPYGNHERRTWRVEGSPEAVQLKLVFERFEVENGYDFVVVGSSSADATRHTGTKNFSKTSSSHQSVPSGTRPALTLDCRGTADRYRRRNGKPGQWVGDSDFAAKSTFPCF